MLGLGFSVLGLGPFFTDVLGSVDLPLFRSVFFALLYASGQNAKSTILPFRIEMVPRTGHVHNWSCGRNPSRRFDSSIDTQSIKTQGPFRFKSRDPSGFYLTDD